jgi:hypothetical protein
MSSQAPANFGAFETIDTSGNILLSTIQTPFIYSPVVFGRYYLSTTGAAIPSVPDGDVAAGLSTIANQALPVPAVYPSIGK